MYLEQRVEQLEQENGELKQRIETLENRGADRFVTAAELARMFGCSTNTVYVKIRDGEIYATRKVGGVRIPMSQFYPAQKVVKLPKAPAKDPEKRSLKEKVFG